MKCECCGISVVEIKCPSKLENVSVNDGYAQTDFLIKEGDNIVLKKTSHKYYTQILMQMAMVGAKHGYFVTWSKHDPDNPLIEKIVLDMDKWSQIQTNVCYFYKKYVMPCLLGKIAINFCVICNLHCLWDNEIKVTNNGDSSAKCCNCGLWYHYKCIMVDSIPNVYTCVACTQPDM